MVCLQLRCSCMNYGHNFVINLIFLVVDLSSRLLSGAQEWPGNVRVSYFVCRVTHTLYVFFL